jgi:hypothetical protein
MPDATDFSIADFSGTWAYATELFGVYQPLLAWRSNQGKRRVDAEKQELGLAVTNGVLNDSRVRREIRVAMPAEPTILGPILASGIESGFTSRLHLAAANLLRRNNRPPNASEWSSIFNEMGVDRGGPEPTRSLPSNVTEVPALGILLRSRAASMQPDNREWQPLAGTRLMAARSDAVPPPRQDEMMVARSLKYLSQVAPQALNAALLSRAAAWQTLSNFVDPLANFDPETSKAILSPMGVVDLYRQYFFDFGSFLGPPVEHVWVSPGGSVELFEVHTRRTLEERQTEIGTEIVTRSETETSELDELSTAVAQQNSRSMSLGISANAGFNLGVVHASTSVNVGLQTTQQTSQQEAHKHSRQQSEKLSNEIRKNFKTTFRTSVETTDTSSRRYVFQNNTMNLVNYELRRKMRRVGVQVQHLGTQLCWQFYVDNPGQELGVAELVHVAQPAGGDSAVPPPEAPATLSPKQVDFTVPIPYESRVVRRGPNSDTYYSGSGYSGAAGGSIEERRTTDNRITAVFTFYPPPPASGYVLASHGVSEVSYDGSDPDNDQPYLSATYRVRQDKLSFVVRLTAVNFHDNRSIRLTVNLTWVPTEEAKRAAQTDYETRVAQYSLETQRAAHAEYVNAIRERIKLASNIAVRPESDLREEERTIIFRQLIAQLTNAGETRADMHVTAELIRSIFEVDKLLYFVAPEWWLPRRRRTRKQQFEGTFEETLDAEEEAELDEARVLTDADTVGWGGVDNERRLNYQITEDAQPARLGASLGWVLQLDGDAHRNAFLNTPWVKAVIPIQPGRELAALEWLQRENIEGTDGLDEEYAGNDRQPGDRTVKDVLLTLARRIKAQNDDVQNLLQTETVFERGFNPLAGGFRHPDNPAPGSAFQVFDQWVEILPTEQVVAEEYAPANREPPQ